MSDIHYIEVWENEWRTLCNRKKSDNVRTTQNPLIVTCEKCKEDMRIAGTYMATRMKLDRFQGVKTNLTFNEG